MSVEPRVLESVLESFDKHPFGAVVIIIIIWVVHHFGGGGKGPGGREL